ncbi:hypothetical protein Glove_329g68 [Diversispora epigaea]|uniref:Zona occludens toxin N-terminal domain-containing protein n=1 Tax=Diversispora epigaea TaxID=1348612 RepID=A0A397HK10_9GLOM|nr:hypothetical protein Glove_329g68 [Diversispora epigaea]
MEHYSFRNLDKSISSKNSYVPKQPFRILASGTSESGKTEMFGHQFLGSKYIKVYSYMIGNKDKDKVPKNENYRERDKNYPWYENIQFKLIGPEKIPDISKFKNTGQKTVIVFDDLAGEPLSIQQKIIPFFRSGRHKGISSIYIAQRYFETHPNIRANLTYISLHRGCILETIKRILKDMYDNYEPISKKVYEVIKKHYVIIDIRRSADDPLSIRFRWDKPLLKTDT